MTLKNCPWCNEPPRKDNIGRAPRNRDVIPTFWHWVYCGNCGARGPQEHTESKAREAWNDRQA